MQQLMNPETFHSPLTRRQSEILLHLASGHTLGRIADKLGISDSTVNMHLSEMKKKLNVKTKEQALALAISNRWISI